MLVLDLVDVQATQLVKSALSDGFGLCFTEIKDRNTGHGFITAKDGFELLTAGACLPHRNDIVNAVLSLDQTLEDVGSGLCFLQIENGPSFHNRLAM